MAHKPANTLRHSLVAAAERVTVGASYRHYRQPGHYVVSAVVILEDTEDVAVAYHPGASPDLTFIRPLESWLATVEVNGQAVLRFTKIA